MKSIRYFLVTMLAIAFALAAIPDAHAKRFGGGRSFGSKPAYSNPFSRSANPKQSYPRQQARARNESLRDTMSRRGGLMGMLGGLALGGLLGSLLFGGAFENINLFDLLVFGALAFLLYKLFAVRSAPAHRYRTSAGGVGIPDSSEFRSDPPENPRYFDTDLMFKKNRTSPGNPRGVNSQDADFESVPHPDGFDQIAFLSGAKSAYRQLQNAWDHGDLNEIRVLTTDSVFSEIKDQIDQRDYANQTDILKLGAELLDVREMAGHWEATVLFDAILREEVAEHPSQVREIWHFIRPVESNRPTWYLDGIQQLEE